MHQPVDPILSPEEIGELIGCALASAIVAAILEAAMVDALMESPRRPDEPLH